MNIQHLVKLLRIANNDLRSADVQFEEEKENDTWERNVVKYVSLQDPWKGTLLPALTSSFIL